MNESNNDGGSKNQSEAKNTEALLPFLELKLKDMRKQIIYFFDSVQELNQNDEFDAYFQCHLIDLIIQLVQTYLITINVAEELIPNSQDSKTLKSTKERFNELVTRFHNLKVALMTRYYEHMYVRNKLDN